MDDKELLASAESHSLGYRWPDGSYIRKWSGGRWSVIVPGDVHPIEREASGHRIFYPTAAAAARALFDAGYGPAKCQKPSLAKAILQDGMARIDEAYRESPAKPKLPPELRQALEWMDDDILPGMEAFGNVYAPLRAWCEAAYDCSPEPPIPPKPPALEPFLIEKDGERKWAYIAYPCGDFGTPEGDYAASNGWRRVEPKQ